MDKPNIGHGTTVLAISMFAMLLVILYATGSLSTIGDIINALMRGCHAIKP